MPFIHVMISRQPDNELVMRITEGIVERTSRLLRKPPEVVSIAIGFVPPEQWTIGGRSLKEYGMASFWLDIKITESTNTKDEKTRYLREVFAFMQSVLGPLHSESYILIHDVRADAYGYGGQSQESRYVRAQLEV